MKSDNEYIESFFFFQAEDGIRDIGVTGVQTCALPIYDRVGVVALAREALGLVSQQGEVVAGGPDDARVTHLAVAGNYDPGGEPLQLVEDADPPAAVDVGLVGREERKDQIGRAHV